VVTAIPSNVMVTVDAGAYPAPVTLTVVPAGPDVGLSVISEPLVPDVLKSCFHLTW
jgi:hypothetical protein